MLTKITLENFKVFRHATEFPLAKINLLTGINGRGKSSLLQSLLLMRQSIEHNENRDKLILNGSCVHLGTWEDIKNKDENNETNIKVSFEKVIDKDVVFDITYHFLSRHLSIEFFSLRSNIVFKYRLYEDAGYYGKMEIDDDLMYDDFEFSTVMFTINKDNPKIYLVDGGDKKGTSYLKMKDKNGFLRLYPNLIIKIQKEKIAYADKEFISKVFTIHYISADRIGAKNFYEKDLNLNGIFITIEKTGKNVLDVISYYKNLEIDNSLCIGTDKDLIAQIGKWLGYILDATVSINLDDSNKFVNSFTYTINGKENLLPTNVGFGYSYILPIVTAGLIAKTEEILIVENPEAHLHPKAQSRLTEFLAKVAATGVQVFVESHSEHILNGLRIATITNDKQNKILEKEDVSILYFDNSETYFKQIKILDDNDLSVWAEDFFDQTNKDYKTIYGY